MSKVYEVYYCYHKGELIYIGQGIMGRSKHCDSGCSHVYDLNRLHFAKDSEPLEVKIVKVSNDKKEVERLEKEAIICLKPKLNTIYTEKGKIRGDQAKKAKEVKKALLNYTDEIVHKYPTDRFTEKYKILCEDFFVFYGFENIINGEIKVYSVDAFKEFNENSLMYLSRYLRKPQSDYKIDNNPYALFCRAMLELYKADLKSLLHTRTSGDII